MLENFPEQVHQIPQTRRNLTGVGGLDWRFLGFGGFLDQQFGVVELKA